MAEKLFTLQPAVVWKNTPGCRNASNTVGLVTWQICATCTVWPVTDCRTTLKSSTRRNVRTRAHRGRNNLHWWCHHNTQKTAATVKFKLIFSKGICCQLSAIDEILWPSEVSAWTMFDWSVGEKLCTVQFNMGLCYIDIGSSFNQLTVYSASMSSEGLEDPDTGSSQPRPGVMGRQWHGCISAAIIFRPPAEVTQPRALSGLWTDGVSSHSKSWVICRHVTHNFLSSYLYCT